MLTSGRDAVASLLEPQQLCYLHKTQSVNPCHEREGAHGPGPSLRILMQSMTDGEGPPFSSAVEALGRCSSYSCSNTNKTRVTEKRSQGRKKGACWEGVD